MHISVFRSVRVCDCWLQPRDIIFGAADEVLSELKRDDITEKKKKVEVEGLLGSLEEEKYALLVGLGRKITDFGVDRHQAATAEGEQLVVVHSVISKCAVLCLWDLRVTLDW